MAFNEVDRAQVLAEALPYIQKYSGKTIVVKYGGNAMISEDLRRAVISDIVLLNLVMAVFIALWSMLLIVPGIIATYRYRFALYNLCENPELGVMDALNMSKQQTRGYKLDLFVLDVTFLGWSFLCVLTAGILSIWITPYIQQTNLGYFEAIKAEKGIGRMPGRSPDEDETFHHDDRF